MNLEDQLRASLRRVEPPPGFAERVVSRLPANPKRGRVIRFRQPVLRWLAVAACLVVAVGGYYEHRQKQGEQAREQLMLALQITETKLQSTQARIEAISQRRIELP